MSLNIKDGNGSAATLKTSLDAGDLVPHHIIDGTVSVTASLTNRVAVTGTVTVNTASSVQISNFPATQVVTSSYASPLYISQAPVTTVTKTATLSFDWTTVQSGTFNLASESLSRKALSIFNPGPSNLYIALSSNGDTKNGFVLTNTSSAPVSYSFILYPSGTYISEPTTVGVYYGGYFISGSNSTGVFVTSIS